MVAGEVGAALDLAELVGPQRQLAVGGDAWVLLAERAGRGVAGVDERAQLGRHLALVERPEGRQGHVDLAPHLEHVGRALAEPVGDLGDRADVLGDVLARAPVAPGGGPHVAAVLVADRDGQAVDLQLAHVADLVGRLVVGGGRRPGQPPVQPLDPGPQLVLAEHVVEAHHRHPVHDRGEHRGLRGAADLLGRRVGRDELGELLLERPQLADQLVVLGVADGRVVELVVAPVVLGDLRAQLRGPLLDLPVGHAPEVNRAVLTASEPVPAPGQAPSVSAELGGPVATRWASEVGQLRARGPPGPRRGPPARTPA